MQPNDQAGSAQSSAPSTSPGADGTELMKNWSMEITHPKAPDLEGLARFRDSSSPVYLSAPPHTTPERLVELAREIRAAGFEPVPHVPVRNFADHAGAREFLEGLQRQADVNRVLVIAGDAASAKGPFSSSLKFIRSGLLQEAGIQEIGIAGYPDGHPKLTREILNEALRAKVDAARASGLGIHVVTQFCFDPKTILAWLHNFRFDFPDVPVRLGLAGPAETHTLVSYAVRCGVKASIRGASRGLMLLKNMKGDATPNLLVNSLAKGMATTHTHAVTLHFFAFGGIVRTAAWAQSLANGEAEPKS